MANPSPLFKLNGGSPGVKASVAAGATVTATLSDTSGVTFVEWAIATTDETTAPGDYTLSTSGGAVPGNETMTFTAGAAGTSGIIRATINHGVNATTGNAASETEPDVTIATAKWYVPTAVSALEVFADAEQNESDATHGQTGELNQAIRALGGGGPGTFTYIELGSGTKATVGLIRTARNFIGWAYRNSLGSNSAIITEDNADGIAFGDQTQTVKIALDVKALGTIRLREAGSDLVTVSGTAVNLTSGVSLQINGVGHTSAATASSLAFRGASGQAAFAYLYASGSVPTTGFIRGQSGFVAVAALTAAGSFDNIGLADDGADGWKVGNDTRAAAVRLAVKTGGSATVEVNNIVEVTMDASGINLASGNAYRVNGVAHTASSTASSIMFRDAAGRSSVADPSASTDIATKNYVDTGPGRIYGPYSLTITHADLTAADIRETISFASALPANSRVAYFNVVLTTPFSGGGAATVLGEIGRAGAMGSIGYAIELFNAAIDGQASTTSNGASLHKLLVASTTLQVQITSDVNVADLTAGSATFEIFYTVGL